MEPRKAIKALVFVTAASLVWICLSAYTWTREISVPPPLPAAESGPDIKQILLWNPFYSFKYYMLSGNGRRPFLEAGCAVDKCAVTTDRASLHSASAVVFHLVGEYPHQLPARATPEQLFVHFIIESPQYHRLKYADDVMNMTVTYRRDSDIFRPYQYVEKLEKPKLGKYQLKYPLEGRTKSVVGLISNCWTVIGREKYMRALGKHIDVDIWGKCGNNTCPSEEKACMGQIATLYNFYLSFENSFCVDYVTEKLRRPLWYDMIPLVLGGTNYTRDAPPHSYINVLDYESPKELAEYLKYLLQNRTAYMEYFQWKNTHKVVVYEHRTAFCKICEILHNDSYHRTHPKFSQWWHQDMCEVDVLRNVLST